MRRLRIPHPVAALVRKLHPEIKRKIRVALSDILDDPLAGKALKEEFEGLRSYRVGHIRIIYRSGSRNIVEIVAIGPRSMIYEETLRLLKRDRS